MLTVSDFKMTFSFDIVSNIAITTLKTVNKVAAKFSFTFTKMNWQKIRNSSNLFYKISQQFYIWTQPSY